MFFNNIRALVSSAYPVLKSLYDDEDWTRLVREFFVEHRSRSPLFPEVPREFLRYIQEQRQSREGDPPFILELAHYQWVSVALNIEATELEEIEADQAGNLLEESPVLSPLAWPVSYNYPVHEICKEFQPGEPPEEATHLLVYRRRDDKVRFMKINAVSRVLLDHMQACRDANERGAGHAARGGATHRPCRSRDAGFRRRRPFAGLARPGHRARHPSRDGLNTSALKRRREDGVL